jgi:hypothetical protein
MLDVRRVQFCLQWRIVMAGNLRTMVNRNRHKRPTVGVETSAQAHRHDRLAHPSRRAIS